MKARLEYANVSPDALKAMYGLVTFLNHSGIEKKLLNLIDLRVSQINGCAYCLDMHWKDLKVEGESDQRLYSLDAWRETPYYTDRERAALAWSEAVTLLNENEVPDDVYEEARKYFSEKELVALTMNVVAINGWNRLNIAFRTVPGTYQPPKLQQKQQELKTA